MPDQDLLLAVLTMVVTVKEVMQGFILEKFLCWPCIKKMPCMKEGLITCVEEKVKISQAQFKNIQYWQYFCLHMGVLLQLILRQGHERQKDVDTGALGCDGSWWHNFCWNPSSAPSSKAGAKAEGRMRKKKIKLLIGSTGLLGQRLFQEQIRGACHCHCHYHYHCPHPRTHRSHCSSTPTHPSPELRALPRTPLWQNQEVPHREILFWVFFPLFICCSENWDTFQACFTVPTMTNYTLTSARLHFVQFCFTQTTCLKSCQNASITSHYLPCRKYQGTRRSQHLNIQ